MKDEIKLREWEPGDAEAIDLLGEQTADTGAVGFYTRFRYDAYEVLNALHPNILGVVAEVAGHEGLVGMGLVSFGECRFEGEVRPYAYMSSLSVHPDYRRRGIASRLAQWRVQAARARFGPDVLVYAGIQGGNTGSLRTAESWSNLRVDGRAQVGFTTVRARPPRPVPGIHVRPARKEDLEQITEKQNDFYREYNLYPPQTVESLRDWLSRPAFGHRLHEYLVAVGKAGSVLAGLGITFNGHLITDHVVRLPPPLRVANLFLRIIPPDGVGRRLSGDRFWFAPGHLEAARCLWESTRWLLRRQGTTMMFFFDPRSPLHDAITLPPFVPRQSGSVVLHAPTPMSEDRLLYWRI